MFYCKCNQHMIMLCCLYCNTNSNFFIEKIVFYYLTSFLKTNIVDVDVRKKLITDEFVREPLKFYCMMTSFSSCFKCLIAPNQKWWIRKSHNFFPIQENDLSKGENHSSCTVILISETISVILFNFRIMPFCKRFCVLIFC